MDLMTSGDDQDRTKSAKPSAAGRADALREARLAQALRANLRRRKAAARAEDKPPQKRG